MPAAANIVQLKELLALKVPGARLGMPDSEPKSRWPTGIKKIDALLRGGLAKGAMTELVAPPAGSGGAMIIQALLQRSCDAKQWMALIDGQDSFDPGPVGNRVLSRLLWVRCETAAQAIQCADLILRDHNLPLIVLDLALNPSQQLRKIPASTWHRFRRLIEDQFTAFVLITPNALASSTQDRLFFEAGFSIKALDQTREELLETIEVMDANQQIKDTRKLA